MEEMRALKQALLNEYGHFADKRIKNVDHGSAFIVDDRTSGGIASDGKPYGWFCEVTIVVTGPDKIAVMLEGRIPQGDAVQTWMQTHGISISRPFHKDQLKFEVGPGDAAKLKELAVAFRSIVRPGVRYQVASYKYACPRAAGALDRLYDVIAGHFGL